MTRAGKEKVGRRMARTSMCDLPPELVRMIFFKIPITSLRAVRSTCKLWESLTKDWILGKAAATRGQFLGFMTMDSKVFSVRFHLCHSKDKDLVTACIMQVDLLNQFEILKVFHCDGVLLCVAKDLERRLMVWNPYLGQTKWIRPLTDFNRFDHYALGYDTSGNHKILRYLYNSEESGFEIYDFNSNSWRLLEVTPDWNIGCGVSVKGNAYFYAIEHWSKVKLDENGRVLDIEDFLIAFDFTTETFGPRLPLPFHSCVVNEHVSLSCVRDEKLAVLYFNQGDSERFPCVEFWVTTTIEPKSVTWSKFLKVNDLPLAVYGFRFKDASFFIDEEEKVAVVFDLYEDKEDKTCYYTVFISGQDGYSKDGILGVALKVMEPCPVGPYCLPVVRYSSYLPSLVQLN